VGHIRFFFSLLFLFNGKSTKKIGEVERTDNSQTKRKKQETPNKHQENGKPPPNTTPAPHPPTIKAGELCDDTILSSILQFTKNYVR
jgi:hypothetical protein